MSQVDDEFNELEGEIIDDENPVNDCGAPDSVLHSEAVLEAAASEQENAEQETADPVPAETCGDQPTSVSAGDLGADKVEPDRLTTSDDPPSNIESNEAAIEGDKPKPAAERKLRPNFKKPVKRIPQEERVGDHDEGHAKNAGAGEQEQVDTDKQSSVPVADSDMLQKSNNTSTAELAKATKKKPKLPVKKAASKAKPSDGPPDPCSFNCASKSTSGGRKDDKQQNSVPCNEGARDAKAPKSEAKTKEKKARRPQAKSAYLFFCSEQRDIIKVDENLNFAEVGKRLGEIWRGMEDHDKQPYQEQAEKDKARVAALPDSQPASAPKPKKARTDAVKNSRTEKVVSDDANAQKSKKDSAASKKANGRRGGSRASKRKASKALGGDVSDDGDDGNEGSDYDWEADHQDVDWTNHPAECILALTMKGKYVVKRKGLPLHEYGLIDSQAAKRHCSSESGASTDVCHVSKEMINDFEFSKKGFEKDTINHMSSRELDLDDLDAVTMLEACAFLGDMRREGLLDKPGCKIWSFPDERMTVPIMGASWNVRGMQGRILLRRIDK